MTPRQGTEPALGIVELRHQVMPYPWGSRTAIAELRGERSPSAEPQAELWMGAHPKAPSEARVDGSWMSLAELIEERPREILGERTAERYGGRLPFLFKVLAAAGPLSIQAHPDRRQAAAGFARENRLGLPLDAAERNYRDAQAKPEIILALSPFTVLRGFRRPDEILGLFRAAGLASHLPEVLEIADAGGLERFYRAYSALDRGQLAATIAATTAAGGALEPQLTTWIERLQAAFPGDRGVLAPLFLNLLELAPGEALFTGPGVLHAYLEGVGLELMANSDNVLRGGLTGKHVDRDELLSVLRFVPDVAQPIEPETDADGAVSWPTPAGELVLSRVALAPGASWLRRGQGVEILLCTEGEGELTGGGETRRFARGASFLVSHAVDGYAVAGAAVVYRASVPAG